MSKNRTAIVVPSAVRSYTNWKHMDHCKVADVSLCGWPCHVVHSNWCNTVGHTSFLTLREAFDCIGLAPAYIGTLGRGGVHEKYHDPANGFLEYTGDMAYVYWGWPTVIKWLNEGWPRPTAKDTNATPGTWCWDAIDGAIFPVLPPFNEAESKQLRSIGVPVDVVAGLRLLSDEEAVDVAARVVKAYRVTKRPRKTRTTQ